MTDALLFILILFHVIRYVSGVVGYMRGLQNELHHMAPHEYGQGLDAALQWHANTVAAISALEIRHARSLGK